MKTLHACPTCQLSFGTAMKLRIHLRAAERGERPKCRETTEDDHPTPVWLWKELVKSLPELRTLALWDPFYCDGTTKGRMKEAGMEKVRYSKVDFFKALDPPYRTANRLIVTNPPFSIKKRIIEELEQRERPYIMLVPLQVLGRKYFVPLRGSQTKIIFPSKAWTLDNGYSKDVVFICRRCGPQAAITWVEA
jgi:hypothetical protein